MSSQSGSSGSRVPPLDEREALREADTWWWIPRGPAVMQELPFRYQWQVTRRHPYYLHYWRYAHPRFFPADELDRWLQQRAPSALFLMLGARGEPVDPAEETPTDESSLHFNSWESGAVMPPLLMAHAVVLAHTLSPDALRLLARVFSECARTSDAEERSRAVAARLYRENHAELNQITNLPMVTINLRAPMTAIEEGVRMFVAQWREQHGVEGGRRRDANVQDYLDVWDLREGWTGSGYDVRRERSFKQIAVELRRPRSTVASQYASAFRLITGRDQAYEVWMRLFLVMKLSFTGAGRGAHRERRFGGARRRSDAETVAETSSSTDPSAESFASSPPPAGSEAMAEFCRRLGELFDAGHSNQDIYDMFGFRDEASLAMIESARTHRLNVDELA